MKHTRSAGMRRALLLAPLLLLGGALVVRSRLPQPQTEGDKWLWEQAERATSLEVNLQALAQDPWMKEHRGARTTYLITNRRGIRSLLRAFEGTSAFALTDRDTASVLQEAHIDGNPARRRFASSSLAFITIKRAGHLIDIESLYLLKKDGQYVLRRWEYGLTATTNPASVQRFNAVLRKTILQAQQGRTGYDATPNNTVG